MRISFITKLTLSYVILIATSIVSTYLYSRSLTGVAGFDFRLLLVWGIISSVAFISLIAFWFLFSKPLQLMIQAEKKYLSSEFSAEFPKVSMNHEIQTLVEQTKAMGKQIQNSGVLLSTTQAAFLELTRTLPIPCALLSPQFEPIVVNSLIRELFEIEPVGEVSKFQRLLDLSEVIAAQETATKMREPVSLHVKLPWQHHALSLLLCPLPASKGELAWAIIAPGGGGKVSIDHKEIFSLFQSTFELCKSFEQQASPLLKENDPLLQSLLVELRISLDLIESFQSEELSPALLAVDAGLLIDFSLNEVMPLLKNSNITVDFKKPASPFLVVEQNKLIERVLRALLVRIVQGVRLLRKENETAIHVDLAVEDGCVKIAILELPTLLRIDDLDRLLAPLGGSVEIFQPSEINQAVKHREFGIWMYLRRA